MFKKQNKNIFISLLLFSWLHANDINCTTSPPKEEKGCNILEIIKEQSSPYFEIREEGVVEKNHFDLESELNITTTIKSLEVTHENQKLLVKRYHKDSKHTCPPFCIQPIKIKGITTVGELEVLNFLKNLNNKEPKLLIDVRSNRAYKRNTIPSAINIPYNMIKDKSKYQKEVLKLLGGKNIGNKWRFKYPSTLLIFAESEEHEEAFKTIQTLLNLSYPHDKIFFYRSGIKSWHRLGLTLY